MYDLLKYSPYKTFRIGQEKAIQDMLKYYDVGKKVINLNAPTASGKGLDLYVFGKVLEKEHYISNIIYTSPQVSLITEGNLFDLPKLVGKRNYKCSVIPGYTVNECPFSSSQTRYAACDTCLYRLAKAAFKKSNFKATTFARYQVDPSLYLETKILLVDESTNLPNALLDSATVNLNIVVKRTHTLNERKQLLQKVISTLDVEGYLKDYSKDLQKKLKEVTIECKDVRKSIIDISRKLTTHETKLLTKIQKDYNHYRGKLDSCNQALRYIKMEVPYVITLDNEEVFSNDNRRKEITINPYFKLLDCKVPFSDLAGRLDCIVLASGTPTTELLTNNSCTINVPHPIPKDRRIIYFDPVGSAKATDRVNTASKAASKILELHIKYRKHTLCHCGTYQYAKLLYNNLIEIFPENQIILQQEGQRQESLQKWISTPNSIFLSVKFDEGLDLIGPEYPLNIIVGIMFPYLGDEWIQARNKYDNWYWYSLSVSTFIQQACGRTTRSPDDWSETYILDSSFLYFYNKNKTLFYDWFVDSLRI